MILNGSYPKTRIKKEIGSKTIMKTNPSIKRLFTQPRACPIAIQLLYGYRSRCGAIIPRIRPGIPIHNVHALNS